MTKPTKPKSAVMFTGTHVDGRGHPHPGEYIRIEVLGSHRLTVTEAAELLGVSRPTLSNLLNGHADLSGLMARRIEKVFGTSLEALMAMKASYDLNRARGLTEEDEDAINELRRYRPRPMRRRRGRV